MSKPRLNPPPLDAPQHWAESPARRLTDIDQSAAALRTGQAHLWLSQDRQSLDFDEFGIEFWRRLHGPRGHVAVAIPAGLPSAGAATLLAAWMGLAPTAVHDDTGGTVSHVISGVGHRHDQSWHTDSTPWREPNHYSVLGLLAGAGTSNHTTDLLPISSLYPGLASDPLAWTALRTVPIPWRRNFPHLPELSAAILGAHQTRWVWPVLEELIDELSPALQRGIRIAAQLMNEVPHFSPTVTATTLLVFDNWRMLHRGPRLEPESGRELIRIKVVGEVGIS